MQIIVVGCGKVGTRLANQLCADGNDVTVIDKNKEQLAALSDSYDILALDGDGSSYATLQDAGIEEADILISVTDSDEKNLLCCLIAKKSGGVATIARVRNPIYFEEVSFFRENFGLSMAVNPEMAGAAEIARVFRFPSAISIETFSKGNVELLTFSLSDDSVLSGKPLKYIHSHLKCDVLVVVAKRGDEVVIPSGDFIVQGGDHLSIVYSPGQEHEFFRKIGVETNRVRTVMIIGGGKMSVYLAKKLLREGMQVKIVEIDRARCEQLSEMLPKAQIINADGIDEDVLTEEGIEHVEGFAALTGIDEQNIMMALFAKSRNPKVKLVTKIARIGFKSVVSSLNLGTIVNPKDITADFLLQFVRAKKASRGSNIENLYTLANAEAEAIEIQVKEASKATGVPLMKMDIKPNILIGKIYRSGKLFTPSGSDTIEVGDSIVLVALSKDKVTNLDDILVGGWS